MVDLKAVGSDVAYGAARYVRRFDPTLPLIKLDHVSTPAFFNFFSNVAWIYIEEA